MPSKCFSGNQQEVALAGGVVAALKRSVARLSQIVCVWTTSEEGRKQNQEMEKMNENIMRNMVYRIYGAGLSCSGGEQRSSGINVGYEMCYLVLVVVVLLLNQASCAFYCKNICMYNTYERTQLHNHTHKCMYVCMYVKKHC